MPPAWALKAGIFDRPNSQDYPSGSVLHWNQTGTGNALIHRRVFDDLEGPFKTAFSGGGEDIDFFRRAIDKGKTFVWCADAVAYETIPIERTSISFQMRRALLRGKASLATAAGRPFGINEVNRRLWCVYYLTPGFAGGRPPCLPQVSGQELRPPRETSRFRRD